MGLREGSYVKLWNAQPHPDGNICYCNATVSRGTMETGYTYLFNGRVTFAGKAAKKVMALGLPQKSDREHPTCKSVKVLGSPDIQTYDNPKNRALLDKLTEGSEAYYFVLNHLREMNVTIWDVEIEDSSETNTKTSTAKSAKAKKITKKVEEEDFMAIPEDSGDELPFDM